MKNIMDVSVILFILVSVLSCSSGQQTQDSSLSLVGGPNECEGVVEVVVTSSNEENEELSPSVLVACSREFDDNEAMVLCAQIGCEGGSRAHPSQYNNYSLPTSANSTIGLPYSCSGNEERLEDCERIGTTCNVLNNNQADIVAVTCNQIDSTPASTTSQTISVQVNTIFVFVAISFSLRATSFITQYQ